MSLYVALRTAPKHVKRGLVAQTAEAGDRATHALVEHLMTALARFTVSKAPGSGAGDAKTPGRPS